MRLLLLLLLPGFLQAQIQGQSSFETAVNPEYATRGVCAVNYSPFTCLQGSTSWALRASSRFKLSGDHSLRCEVRPGDPATNVGSYRAEMVTLGKGSNLISLAPNTFRFCVYVPSDTSSWVSGSDEKIVGMQFHAWNNSYDGGSPNLAIEVKSGRWRAMVRHNNNSTNTGAAEVFVPNGNGTDLGAVTPGKWYVFIIYADFQPVNGRIKIWKTVDGVETVVMNYSGPCKYGWSLQPYPKHGVYWWKRPASGSGTAAVVAYFDLIAYGKSTPETANIDFAVSGSTPNPNQPPICNAGANQSISGTSATLTGTASDPDGSISLYKWERVSGPNTPTITNSTSISTSVTGLVPGAYVFRLTVTDNLGATASSTVGVSVSTTNTPPVASASLTGTNPFPAGTTSVTLDGEATDSQDPDCCAVHTWSQVSGPTTASFNPSAWNPVVTNLSAGAYVFKLRVQDSGGLSSEATVSVVIQASNLPPIVSPAPPYILLNSATSTPVAATASDPEGQAMTYLWSQVSGPNTAVITNGSTLNATVSSLIVGQYTFNIRVTDVTGAYTDATVVVEVNTPPEVDLSGNSTEFIKGTPNINLTSVVTDVDGTISSYKWTVTQFPPGAGIPVFTPDNASSTTVSNLGPGEYIFSLQATDNDGGIGTGELNVSIAAGWIIIKRGVRKTIPK